MFGELMGLLAKLYGCWLMVDVIIFALSMLFSLLSGLESALVEAVTNLIFGAIPFPFNLIIGWAFNPLVIIVQLVITIFLFLYFEKGIF
jgi:uncharacterized membrane protein